jgi:GntR family transcriptional regulator
MTRATNRRSSATAPPAEPASGDGAIEAALSGRSLSRRDGPLYRQVADILREAMEAGALRPGNALPREADLAALFGVSLITVRQALRELESEGRVRKRSAKPTVVTSPMPKMNTAFDFNSLGAIIASTEGRRIEILDYRKRKFARAQEVFGLDPSAYTWCLRAILYVDKRPISHNTFYFAPSVGERLKRDDFDDVVVFRSVQRHLGIHLSGARLTVRAEVADAKLAEMLDYEEGGPILAMEMLYFNTNGEPVELTVNRNRSDAFSLQFEVPNDL